MGLRAMLVHNWEGRMRFGRDDNFSDPFEEWKQGRNERFDGIKPLWYAIPGGVVWLDGLGDSANQAPLGRAALSLSLV